jgi:hypothetical protein
MEATEQIDAFGMSGEFAEALRSVIAEHGPVVDFQPGYVSMRPAGRHVAAYFNKNFVDIVVDPAKVHGVAAKHPGTRVQPKLTSTTAYLRAPAKVLPVPTLVDLITKAIVWREAGNAWSGEVQAGVAADLAGERCRTCNTTISKNGSCWCD